MRSLLVILLSVPCFAIERVQHFNVSLLALEPVNVVKMTDLTRAIIPFEIKPEFPAEIRTVIDPYLISDMHLVAGLHELAAMRVSETAYKVKFVSDHNGLSSGKLHVWNPRYWQDQSKELVIIDPKKPKRTHYPADHGIKILHDLGVYGFLKMLDGKGVTK